MAENKIPVSKIPEGYSTLSPFLVVDKAQEVIDFAVKGFGGKLVSCVKGTDGKPMHASVKIGNNTLMICQAAGEQRALPSMLYVYVDDVDAVYKQAISAGGEKVAEPKDQFYGDRSGGVKDCCDNQWWIGTHIEDVADSEIEKRYAKEGQSKQANSAAS